MKRYIGVRAKAVAFSLAFTLIPLFLLGSFAYTKMSEIVTDRARVASRASVHQIGEQIGFMFSDANDLSLYLIQNASLRAMLRAEIAPGGEADLENLYRLESSLLALVHSKRYVHSINVQGVNGLEISSRGTGAQMSAELLRAAIERDGSVLWVRGVIQGPGATVSPVVSLVRALRDIYDVRVRLGVVRLNVRADYLERALAMAIVDTTEGIQLRYGYEAIATAGMQHTAFEEDDFFTANVPPDLNGVSQATVDTAGGPLLVTATEIGSDGWRLVHAVPVDNVLREVREIRSVLMGLIFLTFVIFFVVLYLFFHGLVSPIHEVGELMRCAASGTFRTYDKPIRNDEVGLLVANYNRMSDQLDRLITTQLKSDLRLREAELTALQNQINPHFLFNTLDTLYWMSRLEKAHQTGDLVSALAKLFRVTLNEKDRTLTVEQELQHMSNYIMIQSCRYGDAVNFHVSAHPDTLHLKTVKLVLQPLVENALRHGIDANDGQGTIQVDVATSESNLLISVSDDGPTSDVQPIRDMLNSHETATSGLGLRNVHERIRLVFGAEYGLVVHHVPGGGVQVIARQPAVPVIATSERVPV